jgi:dTDP-4-amino-4,6-dideoxygalactose transaminase
MLAGLPGLELPEAGSDGEHVWHLYVVRVPDREQVTAVLGELEVSYGIHYPVPVHLTPAFRSLGYVAGDFPVTEEAAARILSLPMFPQITVSQQEQVVQAVRKALG